MRIANGTVVGIDYTLHLGDGTIVDQSAPGEPLTYLHGGGQIVPGLEQALEGLGVGDQKKVVVEAAEGYGEHDARGLQEVPRNAFPDDAPMQIGGRFLAHGQDGESVPFTIVAVTEESVQVDFNHPLAGKALHFDVTVREVREPTDEELEHGHAHGPGGHEDD